MTMKHSLLNQAILRRWRSEASLVRHTMVSRNYGILGGWLKVELYTHPSGDPTGITCSEVFYPPFQDEPA